VLLALGGSVELSSRRRRRRVAIDAFITGMMSTDKHDDEMIEAVMVPAAVPGRGYAFREFGRRHGDFAIVACAAVAHATGIRLAVGGVADRPVARDFGDIEGSALDDALDALAWDLDAREDLHATAKYRRDLVRLIGRATIEEARRCRA
jgi:2-furoyl-CoA dehydrogenase FAD binding subunit